MSAGLKDFEPRFVNFRGRVNPGLGGVGGRRSDQLQLVTGGLPRPMADGPADLTTDVQAELAARQQAPSV